MGLRPNFACFLRNYSAVLKKIFIGLGVLLLFIVGGVVIAPSFIDWNSRLPEIATQVKDATGRDLTIDGKLEVRIFPAPMVTARGVKLGNIQGGTSAHMIALEAVEVRVALMPLLTGQLQVERVRLVKPVITIEKLADGRTNLDFQTAPSAPSTPSVTDGDTSGGSAAGGLDVRLDNFEIKNATLIYLDEKTGRDERVQNLDATLRATSLQGPFEAQGQARLRGVPLAFEVSLGQIIAERTVPVNARISAPGSTHIQVSGAVLGLEAEPRFKGKVKGTGDNLAQFLDALSGSATSPTVLARNFALDSIVNASGTAIELPELELQFATTRVTGAASLGLDAGTTFDVKLKAARIDVDDLLGPQPERALSTPAGGKTLDVIAPQPPANGAATGGNSGFAFPKNVSGGVQLTVDAVTLKGGLVSDVRLNAELADGEVTLSQFQLMAPGVTDVTLSGFVRPKDGKPIFDGSLDVLTSDPKGLAAWLNVKVPQGVASRLKRVAFTTKVVADTEQVSLSALRLVGDRSTVTGGVTVALRKRPSFGADLNLDALDLDIYLNANGHSAPASAAPATETAPTPVAGATVMDALDAWAAFAALNDFDANMKLRVGSLKVKNRTYKDMVADGTLYAGTLDLRTLSLGNFEGASATVSGAFNGFGGVPEMANVKVQAKVKNASALALSLGVKGVPKRLAKVSLNTTAEGSLLKPRFATTVSALGGVFGAQGSFSLLPIGFGYDGTFSAKHPDAVKFFADLDLGYAPSGPLGAMDLRGKLNSNGATHTVTHLQGTIGKTTLSGDVSAVTGGDKPVVTANLETGVLKVDAFLPRPKPGSDKRAEVGRPRLVLASYTQDPPVELAQASKRWSREAFDLAALNHVNGELTLLSEAIQFGDYRLDNADLHALVKNGVMTADRVKGNLFGGPVNGTAQVRADGQPTLRTDISLSALDVARAVKAVSNKDLAGGKLNLNVDFNASGLSPADLVSSLNGRGDMRIGGLDVKQGGSGTALAGIIGLVSAVNQIGEITSGGSNSGLADVGLSFDIQDGVATSNDFTLKSALGSGAGAGRVDLAAWGIDFTGNMTVEANLLTTLLSKGRVGRQEIPFTLKGALDKPGVNLGIKPAAGQQGQPGQPSVDPLQQMLQQVLPGIVPPQPKPQPAPAPQPAPQDGTLAPPPPQQGTQQPSPKQPLTPEQMIQQLMRGM